MSKRTTYIDGWHKAKEYGNLEFYVEGGRLIKGLLHVGGIDGVKVVYPYEWVPAYHCYSKVSGRTARYGCYKKYRWQ